MPANATRPVQLLTAQEAARRLVDNERNLAIEYNRLSAAGLRYVDDVYPIPVNSEERREIASDDESSESSTRFYNETVTQEGDQSSDVVTDSTAEINLDAEFYRQECDRLAALLASQNETLSKQEETLKRLEEIGTRDSNAVGRQCALNEHVSDQSKAMQSLIDELQIANIRLTDKLDQLDEEVRKSRLSPPTPSMDSVEQGSSLSAPSVSPGTATATHDHLCRRESSEVVLPEWSVEVAVLQPPYRESAGANPSASGRQATARGEDHVMPLEMDLVVSPPVGTKCL